LARKRKDGRANVLGVDYLVDYWGRLRERTPYYYKRFRKLAHKEEGQRPFPCEKKKQAWKGMQCTECEPQKGKYVLKKGEKLGS